MVSYSASLIVFYVVLFLTIAGHLYSIFLSLKRKKRIITWILVINFFLLTFVLHNVFQNVLPAIYILYFYSTEKKKKKISKEK